MAKKRKPSFADQMRRAGRGATRAGNRVSDAADRGQRRSTKPARAVGRRSGGSGADVYGGVRQAAKRHISRTEDMILEGKEAGARSGGHSRGGWADRPNYSESKIRKRFGPRAEVRRDPVNSRYYVEGADRSQGKEDRGKKRGRS